MQLCLELYFFKLTQPLTVSKVELLYTLKEKGGKPDRKPYPLPFGLRNPYRNLKSENSQDYAQKPQQNCTFINLASERKKECRTCMCKYTITIFLLKFTDPEPYACLDPAYLHIILYCLFFICFFLLCFFYIPASCSDIFSTLCLLPLFL